MTLHLVPSPCRWDAGDHPACGELQQHPDPGVCEPHGDGQRDPQPAGGEAVLRGLSQGRLSTSRTFGISARILWNTPKVLHPGGAWAALLRAQTSEALQALHFCFGAQHTQSSGTAGCVSSSSRAEIGVSPWLQPPQVNGME